MFIQQRALYRSDISNFSIALQPHLQFPHQSPLSPFVSKFTTSPLPVLLLPTLWSRLERNPLNQKELCSQTNQIPFPSPGQGVYKFAFSNTLVSCSLSLLFCHGEEVTSSYLEENWEQVPVRCHCCKDTWRRLDSAQTGLLYGPPSLPHCQAMQQLCVCVCNGLGVSRHGALTGSTRGWCSVAKPRTMSVASSLRTSTSCAAGAPAGCPALGSLVQSHGTQCRHILWASAVPQVCAASTALSGCLLMVSAPTEVLLLSLVPDRQLSQTLPT